MGVLLPLLKKKVAQIALLLQDKLQTQCMVEMDATVWGTCREASLQPFQCTECTPRRNQFLLASLIPATAQTGAKKEVLPLT